VGYQYFFAALKLYAAATLNNTSWGTRDANAFKDPALVSENSGDRLVVEERSHSTAGNGSPAQQAAATEAGYSLELATGRNDPMVR
jgi:hypothetical protein